MFKKDKLNKPFRLNTSLNSEFLKRFKTKDPLKLHLTKKNLYHLEGFFKGGVSKYYYSKRRITKVLPREKKQSFRFLKQMKETVLARHSAYKG